MGTSVRAKNPFLFNSLVKLKHLHRKYSRKPFSRRRFPKCELLLYYIRTADRSHPNRLLVISKQENVIGQTDVICTRRCHQGAPTTAWIVKRREIQITIILSRSNCSVTRDSGRDCIKDISRNQLCSDLPKFLLQIRPHRYRTLLSTTSSVPAKYRNRVTLGPNLVRIRIGPRPNFGGSFVHINK